MNKKLIDLLNALRKLGFDMDCEGPDEENEDVYLGCIGNLCVSIHVMKDEE